jgi:hypothetical protein
MTTKFTVHTESFEFNPRHHKSILDAFLALTDTEDKLLGMYDTLAEARDALAAVKVDTRRYSYNLAHAVVAYIYSSEYEQDEDGEWEFISGSDMPEFKAEELPSED